MPVRIKKKKWHTGETSDDYFAAREKVFGQAILRGDHESAERITGELLSSQQTLGDIYLKVIGPALVNVGDLWCRGNIGVGEQKLATQIVMAQMDRLRAVFARREARSAHRILVSCVEGEFHFVGARMVADLCLARGWHVDFLGPDVPNDALIELIKGRHPQVLALSLTMPGNVAKARAVIEIVERQMPAMHVVVGGQGVAAQAQQPKLGALCEVARDALAGITIISALLRADRPAPVLKEYQQVLARRVRELRSRKGWTQERLAKAAQVTRVCIVAIEGSKQNVSMDILIRLANALGVGLETLLSLEV